ncbi:hypothetical protein F5Y17DRAFT_435733 [Xylariaceae sp. FL0594]|nr:hypothetical protein F5Y17DRAFT_435733 [Xylariaceae sp. FL0594]
MALFGLTCFLGFILPLTAGLQVTPNSPCASVCIDSAGGDISNPNSSSTGNDDITCNDSEYASSKAGQKFQRCISCLQESKYTQGEENDQLWFLYNIRYAFDNCIFGFPDAKGIPSTPCSTSTACGALEAALTGDGLKPTKVNLDYSFCDVDGDILTSPMAQKCKSCVGATGDQSYLVNYLVALEAGCSQRPAAGTLIGLNATVFSSSVIGAEDPSSRKEGNSQPALPTTSIVGIAVGAGVVLLAIALFFYVRHRKQRRRSLRLEVGESMGGSIMSNGKSLGRGRRHHRASSLSFRCQTHLTPRSPAFFTTGDEIGDEEKKEYYPVDPNINPHLALGSHPVTPESHPGSSASVTTKPSAWQQYQQKQETPYSSTQSPYSRPLPLRSMANINTTTTTTTTPTVRVPDNVYQYQSTSPRSASSRFSPLDERERETPISTTSTKSTAQLLPKLRPYNPAEYGVTGWNTGEEASAYNENNASTVSTFISPTSAASTASPLLSSGRAWEQQQQNQSQGGMSPIWERPRREWESSSSLRGALRVPLSPGKKRNKMTGQTGSPTEVKHIDNTKFPAPPSPRARWGQ